MNIVIPYKHEVHNGLELRYALRSIEKYLTGYDEIYLIGVSFPGWIKNVKFIAFTEQDKKSSTNILNKIMASFDVAGYSVLQWQDDIFLTKPLDVRDIPYWYEGNLEQAIEKSRGNYRHIIENTARKITDEKLYFDIHTPIIYDRKLFEMLTTRYRWWKTQYLVKSCYYDIASEYINLPTAPMQDVKLHGPETKRERMDKINGGMFFSTSQQAIDPDMIEIFEQLYPEKSNYEAIR